ncbi:MAG: PilC/PilY family type IV pilus protein [Gammaproteobacteria bacterium]|nr:PilC/PilY family type IV pilus protein [Gammaproteobacteria bacterium]
MKTLKTFFITALLAGICIPAQADDTDVYLDPNSSLGSEPLVMLSLDYRSNLASTICSDASSTSCTEAEYFRNLTDAPALVDAILADIGTSQLTFFDILRLSLVVVFDELDGVKVGLMMSHDNNNNCVGFDAVKCSNGGYILSGFRSMYAGDSNGNKEAFFKVMQSIPTPQGNVSHSFQGKELYFEFFRYLTGQGIYNGHNGYTDFGTNNSQNIDVDNAGASWDENIETPGNSDNTYISPLDPADLCSKIFVINFLDQVSNQDSDSDDAITATKANGGMAGINLSGNNNSFDTVIEYLRDVDLADGTFGTAAEIAGEQTVISYFVVTESSDNNTTNGYATAGGTDEVLIFSEDPAELVETISRIFNEILSVSTTFVAASVPVNVFNRSQTLDSVYLALFEADGENKPFWAGNLKKLRVETDLDGDGVDDVDADGNKVAALVDSNGERAIASDGRIEFDAETFWTMTADLPPADPDELEVDGADGRSVTRGGAGQKIPGFITGVSPGFSNGAGYRNLYYDSAVVTNGITNSLQPFNTDSTTVAALLTALGTTDTALAARYIAHTRGMDVQDLDNDGIREEARPWMLGDPLHSRPLPINFGNLADPDTATENPDIYIAMSTNDGFMHFFKDTDDNGNSNVTEGGKEVWGFIPQEVMGELSVRYDNDIDTGPSYTVDGPPAAYLEDINQNGTIESSEDTALLFFGLRRGGKAYYALDVTTPESPSLRWRITKTTGGDFDELGQTWAQPQVGEIDVDGALGSQPAVPIVVFPGGYDTNKDARSETGAGTADSEGNAIYVVNAKTGALIWKAVGGSGTSTSTIYYHASLTDSIPSDIATVDTDGDGYVDRGYVGDTGGKVWRIDMSGTTDNWQVSLLANLGSDSTRVGDRRFFHAPDVVQSKDGPGDAGKYDAVIIGSGDRANPLDRPVGSTPTDNFIFVIKDRYTSGASATYTVPDQNFVIGDLLDVTDYCLGTDTVANCDPGGLLSNGWKYELAQGTGEKLLSSPLTVANQVFATSYLPLGKTTDEIDPVDVQTCGPSEGSGLLYTLGLDDGRPVLNYNEYNDSTTDSDGDGENDEILDATDAFTDVSAAGIPAGGVAYGGEFLLVGSDVINVGDKSTWRTYWYEVEDRDSY